MLTVRRYIIPCISTACHRIKMPWNAKPLSVKKEGDKLYIWALVDPDAEVLTKMFIIAEEDEAIDTPMITYIGSIQNQWRRCHIFML